LSGHSIVIGKLPPKLTKIGSSELNLFESTLRRSPQQFMTLFPDIIAPQGFHFSADDTPSHD
jgi:hypothetical protein